MTFSIIIPVYNKAATLQRCILSVISQECNDWELLLIDDGSDDDSLRICEKFKSEKIRVFHHINHGVSYTRNKGIEEANGKYILFVDADDYLDEDFLSTIYIAVDQTAADIYFTGITKVYTNGRKEVLTFPLHSCIGSEEFKKNFYKIESSTGLYGYVANKVIRRELLLENEITFDTALRNSEDFDFFLRCYQHCRSFCYVKTAGYNYIHYSSGTSIYNKVDYLGLIKVQERMYNWLSNYMDKDDINHFLARVASFSKLVVIDRGLKSVLSIPADVSKLRQVSLVDDAVSNNYNDFIIAFIRDQRILALIVYTFFRSLYLSFRKLI